MRTPGEVQLPPEKIVDVCINGRTVHVNVMQPMQVRFVEDSSLPSSKRSDAVFARYRGVISYMSFKSFCWELGGFTGYNFCYLFAK